jgi:hypothetical protein
MVGNPEVGPKRRFGKSHPICRAGNRELDLGGRAYWLRRCGRSAATALVDARDACRHIVTMQNNSAPQHSDLLGEEWITAIANGLRDLPGSSGMIWDSR